MDDSDLYLDKNRIEMTISHLQQIILEYEQYYLKQGMPISGRIFLTNLCKKYLIQKGE